MGTVDKKDREKPKIESNPTIPRTLMKWAGSAASLDRLMERQTFDIIAREEKATSSTPIISSGLLCYFLTQTHFKLFKLKEIGT